MTSDEENRKEAEKNLEELCNAMNEQLSVITGMIRDVSDKADELLKLTDSIHETVSYNHGSHDYDSEQSFLDELDE